MELQELAWMSGHWSAPIWGGTFEEVWLPPSGNVMVGAGRHVGGDGMPFVEYLSIEENPEQHGITMWVQLGRLSKDWAKKVAFRLIAADASSAVFENPQNQFPSRITYRLAGTGQMHCRIEGSREGEAVADDFHFTRVGVR
jgi:hypothetical protein